MTFGEFGSGEYVPARRETSTFEVTSAPIAGVSDTDSTLPVVTRTASPNLDLVFDDPTEGEPGRDRMIVHGVWELVLALALAAVGYLLYRADSSAFSAGGLRVLLLNTTILGLIAAAAAVGLRAGAPNLAVGAVAIAAAGYYGQHSGDGVQRTLLIMVGAAAAVGLVQGLVVVGLQVPAWATGLAVGLGLFAWAANQGPATLTGGYDPSPHAYYWFGGFCALSLAASLVGLIPTVRRAVGRFRPVADPARRRGTVAALIVVAATIASTLLAAVGGILSVLMTHRTQPGDGLELTALALGAALLGGTSAFGRRGGILGTIFAAGLVTMAIAYGAASHRTWPAAAFAAASIGLGLAVTRLVERFGRPSGARRSADDEDWVPKVHALTPAGRSWQPAPTSAGGLWASDDAWGTIESR